MCIVLFFLFPFDFPTPIDVLWPSVRAPTSLVSIPRLISVRRKKQGTPAGWPLRLSAFAGTDARAARIKADPSNVSMSQHLTESFHPTGWDE